MNPLNPNPNQQSLEGQALNGQAGQGRQAQQTQNFMSALRGVGAGSNNTFMQNAPQQQSPMQALIGAGGASNGSNNGLVPYNNGSPYHPPVQGQSSSSNIPNSIQQLPPNVYNNQLQQVPHSIVQGSNLQQGYQGGQVINPYDNVAQQQSYQTAQMPISNQTQQQSQSYQMPVMNAQSQMYNPYIGQSSAGQQQSSYNPYAMSQSYYTPSSLQGYMQQQKQLGMTGMVTSDENQKTEITSGDRSVSKFLNSINAWEYEYKHPELDGGGKFVSPMAQELEKTELGKQAVIETPRGKMVNYQRLSGLQLAAIAMLNERLNKFELKLKKGK